MSLIEGIVLISLIAYRTARFVLDDGLPKAQRSWLLKKILVHWERDFTSRGEEVVPDAQAEVDGKIAHWRLKLWELLTCPYCMTVWMAAGATAATELVADVPSPVLTWLASCGGAMIVWKIVED